MHGITRRRALGGGAAFFSLAFSVVLMASLFVASSAISRAQTDGDKDKVAVTKVAAQGTVNAGDTITFTITVTTQPFPIDGVVLSDVLPVGITWTVSGADAVAAGCAGVYAGGSTLTCNFGTLGDFGVAVTKTVTVSGQASTANCPIVNNTARVQAAASEEETLLANNTSSASVNVVCRATPTATPVPPSPTPTPPSARIVPTGTTCEQFRNGTASDLNAILYGVRSSGNIGNVAPGIGFYFVSLPGTGSYTITQSDNGTTLAFGVQSVQIYFAGTCTRDSAAEATISTVGASTSMTVTGAHIVRLAFDPNTVVGSAAPSPSTVTYQYTTIGAPSSTDTISLAPKP